MVCLAFYYVALMTSSLFVIQCSADELPCPSPCECYKENIHGTYGEVNRIICSNLGLTAVPDLTVLEGSAISNNLELDQNEINEISKSDFPPGLKIVILDLSQNRGIHISTDTFINLGYSLRKLSLEAVDIVYDKTLAIFDSLFRLEELSLNTNNKHPYTEGAVQNVKAPLFQGEVAKNLKSLKLAYCGIRTMGDETLKSLRNLEELDLSNNWFTAVPSAINQLPNLRFVEFFYCRIKSLKDNDFSNLPKLETIDLSSNTQLSTISDTAFFGCENSLNRINLQRCGLTQIPTKALKNLKKLTLLDISENRFSDVGSAPLAGDYKLEELVMSSKNLKFGPETFKGQEDTIGDLSIPRMDMQTIPLPSLLKLTKLRRLSLEYNNITMLPTGAFEGLNTTSIRLDNNPLSYIEPGAFRGLPSKLVISLRRTKMADIEFLLDYPEYAIDTVNIEHSSLKCQCSMKNALNVTQTIQIYGSCSKGNKTLHITSRKLGPILDQACDEERGSNSINNIPSILISFVVVSLATMIVNL